MHKENGDFVSKVILKCAKFAPMDYQSAIATVCYTQSDLKFISLVVICYSLRNVRVCFFRTSQQSHFAFGVYATKTIYPLRD